MNSRSTQAPPPGVLPRYARSLRRIRTNLRRERQMEGIAKANHVYKGRKASIGGRELRRLVAEGLTPTQIAARLKIARQSVYRDEPCVPDRKRRERGVSGTMPRGYMNFRRWPPN